MNKLKYTYISHIKSNPLYVLAKHDAMAIKYSIEIQKNLHHSFYVMKVD